MNSLPDKLKREERRRNHVARDLGTIKYHQRVIPNRKTLDEMAPRHHEGVSEHFSSRDYGEQVED